MLQKRAKSASTIVLEYTNRSVSIIRAFLRLLIKMAFEPPYSWFSRCEPLSPHFFRSYYEMSSSSKSTIIEFSLIDSTSARGWNERSGVHADAGHLPHTGTCIQNWCSYVYIIRVMYNGTHLAICRYDTQKMRATWFARFGCRILYFNNCISAVPNTRPAANLL